MAPAIIMTNMVAPSPTFAKVKLRPHKSHSGFNVMNPSKSFPLPQRGHRHNNPVEYGEDIFA
jgi:hypothetical protein